MSATSEPQIEDESSQSIPPPYSEAVDKTTILRTPGPARNGRIFYDIPGERSIRFSFRPQPLVDNYLQPWFGQMDVKCDDVPLLMREGFYWTTANIIKEEGFVENINPQQINLGHPNNPCTIKRYWFLQDLQQPPRWTASLQIHAPNYDVISKVRFENWSINMIRSVEAWGLSKKTIYSFSALTPKCCISIYDDMPLKGWWPWPKEAKA
ncbi:hypothetical protein F4820DRAFT_407846 [Hypoxylon rubiginosum]|uniref:Uncharacterized protein n=1 Tax=Hypoxylon rubiginosum TaxID=110542 RepID=A0ACB9ZBW2_9PEZI|nr:hypothetical protein F4820DRAFT_407846 [Hypoxylon rubiginosum]